MPGPESNRHALAAADFEERPRKAHPKDWNATGSSWPLRLRPFPELSELRELVISFGDSDYVAIYHHEPADAVVYVLAFCHQKLAGPHD